MNAILAGAAVTLMVSAFSDFLRSYTEQGLLPPFTMFIIFWTAFGATQGIQSFRVRVAGNDQ